jgi:hypothetical protein
MFEEIGRQRAQGPQKANQQEDAAKHLGGATEKRKKARRDFIHPRNTRIHAGRLNHAAVYCARGTAETWCSGATTRANAEQDRKGLARQSRNRIESSLTPRSPRLLGFPASSVEELRSSVELATNRRDNEERSEKNFAHNARFHPFGVGSAEKSRPRIARIGANGR